MAFIRSVYAAKFNIGLKHKSLANEFATGEFSQKVEGNQMVIETIGRPTSQDVNDAGTGWAWNQLSNTTKTVILTEHKVFAEAVSNYNEWVSKPSLQKATSEVIEDSVAIELDDYVLNKMYTEATSFIDLTAVTITADNILDVLFTPLLALFIDLKVPANKRKIALDATLSSLAVKADVANKQEGISHKGYLGNIMGIMTYETTTVVALGKGNIAGNPDAFAFGYGLTGAVDVFPKLETILGSGIRMEQLYGGDVVSDSRADELIQIRLVA